jgi:DNA ligase-1
MLFAEVAETSAAVASTSKRTEKVAQLATVLRAAAPDEVAPVVGFLTGTVRQGRIGVGWASLRSVQDMSPSAEPSLTVIEVDRAFDTLAATSGKASQERRRAVLVELFAAATAREADMLAALIGGELRQGALDRVMAEAVAKASEVPAVAVRRAAMLSGDLAAAAVAALGPDGTDAVAAIGLRVGTFVQPMLASPGDDLDSALGTAARVSVEWKLDGARVEVHRRADDVWIYTRNGNDVTDRLPGIADLVRGFPGEPFVLDGEAIGLTEDGAPRKFQDTMSRFGTEVTPGEIDLHAFFFDVLHAEGVDLIDQPLEVRQATLDLIATRWVVPRTTDRSAAHAFTSDALARRHEGVMVKDLDSPYEAGRRGASWRKVKPVTTLDLVVLGAEWGHGRRTGWLSNLHLGARAEDGSFVMVGKTFKGMTDQLLNWQTARLQEIAERTEGHIVWVHPQLVVEIALDGVQRSTRYPGGVALRFARVKGYRPDKSPADADTIDTVRSLLA